MTRFLSLADAVADYVHDGDVVALEGFTHLIPFAAGHEIIRQKRRNLTLVRMTPDVIYDQLIGTATRRKTSGPCRSKSKSTRTQAWPRAIRQVPPGFRSACCEGTWAPTS